MASGSTAVSRSDSDTSETVHSGSSGPGSPDESEEPDEPESLSETNTVIQMGSTKPVTEISGTNPTAEKGETTDSGAKENPAEGAEQGEDEAAVAGESEVGLEETEVIRSKLPKDLQGELAKPGNGIILIYHPEKYDEIKAITGWSVVEMESSRR